MSVEKLLSAWRADPAIAISVETWHNIPARKAVNFPIPNDLHPNLARAVQQQGISELYSHQAMAWKLTREGKNIVVACGTASGKTLCYNLTILDRLLRDPEARALYIFPTKALAQDQSTSLQILIDNLRSLEPHSTLALSIYDGDTPSQNRTAIRAKTRLLFTNPDMLHIGILPHHTKWIQFLRHLVYVVIDEAHIYRGVFGSHVANVIRRLKRITKFYGAFPIFIMTSATFSNPKEFAERLVDEKIFLIDEDGSTRGAKKFLIYNPPFVNRELGLRKSSLQESVRLASDLYAYDIQTIIFGRSRRTVELILTYLREAPLSRKSEFLTLRHSGSNNINRLRDAEYEEIIRGYRSGYLPGKRREIERELRIGKVRVVVATNALELGIDIGGMGASILVGFPGTIASTWQQAGRAGRGQETSMTILVTTADPLDQFLASHPEYIFQRSPEQALINPNNPLILLDHLRCAAFELPFIQGENYGNITWEELHEFLDFLCQQGILHLSGNKFFWMADNYPAQSVSLRSASNEPVVLQIFEEDRPQMIGQVDQVSARWMVHPQAIYLQEGQTYLVEDLDMEQNIARLKRVETDYFTSHRSETTVQVLDRQMEEKVRGGNKVYGEIQVTTQVTGFRKIKWYTHEQIGLEDLNMPPTELITTGYWLTLDTETTNLLRENKMWRNDPIDYSLNWKEQRKAVLNRDLYACQVCGAPEKDRSHEVHHIIPFRTFSSFEQANHPENLITLCTTCHQRVEMSVRVRSGLAGLAYTFGQLAPLFLMCDTGDLGVHSDPQSPFADGQPTIMLYDQVPAGIGLSQRIFEIHQEIIRGALELVSKCGCLDGCPSCVGPGGENGLGGKEEALAILNLLVQQSN